eukprot:TRINITY_DN7571_c0_g1_i2.p2 TRINITY_DN7571_c0_g1~~TRINITY_DN7571_c0_g1_i2.p2  ORF type:complete len:1410 (+),score=262.91 TRINITY_DN7571_c0_g1_i2:83-4312(+)
MWRMIKNGLSSAGWVLLPRFLKVPSARKKFHLLLQDVSWSGVAQLSSSSPDTRTSQQLEEKLRDCIFGLGDADSSYAAPSEALPRLTSDLQAEIAWKWAPNPAQPLQYSRQLHPQLVVWARMLSALARQHLRQEVSFAKVDPQPSQTHLIQCELLFGLLQDAALSTSTSVSSFLTSLSRSLAPLRPLSLSGPNESPFFVETHRWLVAAATKHPSLSVHIIKVLFQTAVCRGSLLFLLSGVALALSGQSTSLADVGGPLASLLSLARTETPPEQTLSPDSLCNVVLGTLQRFLDLPSNDANAVFTREESVELFELLYSILSRFVSKPSENADRIKVLLALIERNAPRSHTKISAVPPAGLQQLIFALLTAPESPDALIESAAHTLAHSLPLLLPNIKDRLKFCASLAKTRQSASDKVLFQLLRTIALPNSEPLHILLHSLPDSDPNAMAEPIYHFFSTLLDLLPTSFRPPRFDPRALFGGAADSDAFSQFPMRHVLDPENAMDSFTFAVLPPNMVDTPEVSIAEPHSIIRGDLLAPDMTDTDLSMSDRSSQSALLPPAVPPPVAEPPTENLNDLGLLTLRALFAVCTELGQDVMRNQMQLLSVNALVQLVKVVTERASILLTGPGTEIIEKRESILAHPVLRLLVRSVLLTIFPLRHFSDLVSRVLPFILQLVQDLTAFNALTPPGVYGELSIELEFMASLLASHMSATLVGGQQVEESEREFESVPPLLSTVPRISISSKSATFLNTLLELSPSTISYVAAIVTPSVHSQFLSASEPVQRIMLAAHAVALLCSEGGIHVDAAAAVFSSLQELEKGKQKAEQNKSLAILWQASVKLKDALTLQRQQLASPMNEPSEEVQDPAVFYSNSWIHIQAKCQLVIRVVLGTTAGSDDLQEEPPSAPQFSGMLTTFLLSPVKAATLEKAITAMKSRADGRVSGFTHLLTLLRVCPASAPYALAPVAATLINPETGGVDLFLHLDGSVRASESRAAVVQAYDAVLLAVSHQFSENIASVVARANASPSTRAIDESTEFSSHHRLWLFAHGFALLAAQPHPTPAQQPVMDLLLRHLLGNSGTMSSLHRHEPVWHLLSGALRYLCAALGAHAQSAKDPAAISTVVSCLPTLMRTLLHQITATSSLLLHELMFDLCALLWALSALPKARDALLQPDVFGLLFDLIGVAHSRAQLLIFRLLRTVLRYVAPTQATGAMVRSSSSVLDVLWEYAALLPSAVIGDPPTHSCLELPRAAAGEPVCKSDSIVSLSNTLTVSGACGPFELVDTPDAELDLPTNLGSLSVLTLKMILFRRGVTLSGPLHRPELLRLLRKSLENQHQHDPPVSVRYTGVADSPPTMLRCEWRVPHHAAHFYWEIEIVDQGDSRAIGIGLFPASQPLDGFPGWAPGSYGYHGDDGKKTQW